MMKLVPTDRAALAKAVADTVVAAVDPVAQQCGIFYSVMARPWTDPVLDALRAAPVDRVRAAGLALLDEPAVVRHYQELQDALLAADGDPAVAELFELAWRAEERSRIGVHIGPDYGADVPFLPAETLRRRPTGPRLSATATPEILVVVPFQEREDRVRNRLRNLLACLQALHDQSYPRDGYRVVVVETDDRDRHREIVEPFCDDYVLARKSGIINKSWAVNVGVVEKGGSAEVLCLLDADVLTDRDFIARNVARFQRAGTGGHLPHRDMFCLDRAATSWAIEQRLAGAAAAPLTGLRGFFLRRSPGCCIWVRREAFLRIGGLDERFEGWGGEDYDLFGRLDMATPIDHFDDTLLHMHHPPSSKLNADGTLVTSDIAPLTWKPTEPIGQVHRFAEPAGASAD